MSDNEEERMVERELESEVREMNIKGDGSPVNTDNVNGESAINRTHLPAPQADGSPVPTPGVKSENASPASSPSQSSRSPTKDETSASTPLDRPDLDAEQVVGGDIELKMEPGKAPKLSRTSAKKIPARPPPLFDHLPDATSEACDHFEVIKHCIYAAKYLGETEPALECDCAEEWDATAGVNHACGEESDCINRATKMECIGDCGCGVDCQNQRFQKQQFADVSVIKTEKKGFGLRTNKDLKPNEFIFEYIGEVIHEGAFRRRMLQYDEAGIKHFYFMSLSKGEFVDATKRGNLGRFCNHSCNPNCYVDKWVVGDKLRMGIFAERGIKAGEELVFNYNVDRYGADPQPCYCGEPNCTGFIGGKTQTDTGTKLSHATIEALGIDDEDGWDFAVPKKPRKKKASEDDEEYVDSVQPRSLDEGGVTKVMAALMQCKEKWIAVKLLSRIQRCEDERVINRVVKMHGYRILKTTLGLWMDDFNVCLQVFDILFRLPRLTRNKIQDSKIEETVEKLKTCGDERVEQKATEILQIWSQLQVGYRIPRIKRDPNAAASTPTANKSFADDRRNVQARTRSRSRSRSPPRGPTALTGPRGNGPSRPPRRPPPPRHQLPAGWFVAQANGRTYYYNSSGETTWTFPTHAAGVPQPPPPPQNKAVSDTQKLQAIIQGIVQSKETPTPSAAEKEREEEQRRKDEEKLERERERAKRKAEKWKSYPKEKQMKLYENTIFKSVIKDIMKRYVRKLPSEDLKRFAKEINKKIVASDYKNNRVTDPTKLTEKQESHIKKFVKDFFEKAVAKKRDHDKRKAEKAKASKATSSHPGSTTPTDPVPESLLAFAENTPCGSKKPMENGPPQGADLVDENDMLNEISDDEDDVEAESPSSQDRKRKRDGEEHTTAGASPADEGAETPDGKRQRIDTPPPPPPPPPPPADEDLPTPADEVDKDAEMGGMSGGDDAQHAAHGHGNGILKHEQPNGVTEHHGGPPGKENPPGGTSPVQLATPSTHGSCERESDERNRQNFDGMSEERLRMLGVKH